MTMLTDQPWSREEWHQAATYAAAALVFDEARNDGLFTGGPEIDVERCRDLIALAEEDGIKPSSEEVRRVAGAIIVELVRDGTAAS